ncbi:hypothetical protein BRYFOR_07335 [Marvinbryantia formatexigens DSM 14469]|uniref:Uncharacterized protein n=1 Tax=Marvinbryantia formatexigens DSM 14469 TaxID=478749 RepID=C6LFD2_9FIRM|nr:hypothetical protein BRYFOR_07335 [Marvinbryantia formatexigens DSM 14469]SDG21460.1 hypothetical protein SAMN05660368_02150 [Marvinbryantia formatexigens]
MRCWTAKTRHSGVNYIGIVLLLLILELAAVSGKIRMADYLPRELFVTTRIFSTRFRFYPETRRDIYGNAHSSRTDVCHSDCCCGMDLVV